MTRDSQRHLPRGPLPVRVPLSPPLPHLRSLQLSLPALLSLLPWPCFPAQVAFWQQTPPWPPRPHSNPPLRHPPPHCPHSWGRPTPPSSALSGSPSPRPFLRDSGCSGSRE